MVEAGVHILVIDDEPETLGALSVALRAQNWRVSIATDGRQGFQRAQVLAPDVILLDVMPGTDGLVVCRLLRESPRTGDVPVIFLSAVGTGEDRLRGLQAGGADYVTKPLLPAEVVARIRVQLQRIAPAIGVSPTGPMPLLSDGELILRAAMRWISAHLGELPPLADLACQVGTHDKKLSAIFRQYLGMTVFAWVREERLRVSREWLADSEMNIQDIAAQVGFHSAANFATAFRQRVGMTPSQFRENARNGNPAS